MMKPLIFLLACLIPGLAKGANITAASASRDAVQAAVNSASDGDTILIPNGSATWTNGISTTKQIIIRAQNITSTPGGNTTRNVVITANNTSGPLFDFVTGNSFHCGLAGIRFNWGSRDDNYLEVSGSGTKPMLVWDCYFEVGEPGAGNAVTTAIIDWSAQGGVVWNCRFVGLGTGGVGGIGPYGACFYINSPRAWNTASTMGTLDTSGIINIYMEDCSALNVSQFPDIDENGRFVSRHNTLDGSWGLTHGFTSNWGGRHFEYYNNTFSATNPVRNLAGRYFWARAGTGIFTDNVVNNAADPGEYGAPVQLDIGDNTSPGPYPQPRQPGFGHNGTANVSDPIYIWNQTGARAYAWGVQSGWESNVQLNRDIFVNSGAKPGYAKYPYPHPLRASVGAPGGAPALPPAATPPPAPTATPAATATPFRLRCDCRSDGHSDSRSWRRHILHQSVNRKRRQYWNQSEFGAEELSRNVFVFRISDA